MSKASLIAPDAAAALVLAESISLPPDGIVSRTLLQTREARVVLFCFDADQELTSHTNPRRALVQILSGSCDFEFAGKWQRLEAGTLLHLPPNHPHGVRAAQGPFSMLLTLIGDGSASASALPCD